MKNYKNWEKRVALFIGQFLTSARNNFLVWWKGFIKKGNEKVTIMLIPHNQKKILNIHVSLFSLAFFLIFLSVVFIVFFISISTLSSTTNELSNVKMQYVRYQTNYNDMIGRINDLYTELMGARGQASSLASIYTSKIDLKNGQGIGGPDIEMNPQNADPYEQISLMENASKDFFSLFTEWNSRRDSMMDMARNIPSRLPIENAVITSPFGIRRNPFNGVASFHPGLDLAAMEGAPEYATADGEVTWSTWREGYGICVIIKHKYGFETLYGHMMLALVTTGQKVKKGQIIGKEGQTGWATGPHLHYEVHINGNLVNPVDFLNLAFERF